jgi:hypothetical protein
MGRWAYFHGDSGVSYDYKFWFGTQESHIPWADHFEEQYIPDYEEDEADDKEMSEEHRELWKKHADSHVSFESEELTYEEIQVLEELGQTDYNASDYCSEEKLQERWAEVNDEAKKMGLELFSQKEGESPEDAIDRYYETIIAPVEEANGFGSAGKDFGSANKDLADLYLKTAICAMLPKFGYSYECHYEC